VNFAGRVFYQLGIAGFKAALCITYLRLLAGGCRKGYTLLVWAVMIISTLGHIAGTLALIMRCQPVCQPPLIRHLKKVSPTFSAQVFKSWEPTVDGSCLPVGPPSYALAGFSIACDLAIILLPIPLLLELRIGALKKAGLCGLFLLGFFHHTILNTTPFADQNRYRWRWGYNHASPLEHYRVQRGCTFSIFIDRYTSPF
jgi:hypothetical protein